MYARFRENLPFNAHYLDVVFAATPDIPVLRSVLTLSAEAV